MYLTTGYGPIYYTWTDYEGFLTRVYNSAWVEHYDKTRDEVFNLSDECHEATKVQNVECTDDDEFYRLVARVLADEPEDVQRAFKHHNQDLARRLAALA